ncbi:anhydro-N-acetylmuramic acid kinase [Kozakia baliensis]|uniref:anhydro-N-acetylmuramic acid kinase n=1 Tax=Kozakia baliensis TaxID=153496 RepID=UPI0004957B1D|nr:anhydro-N-acetylmuramic acid kinase [Kozakia baliensis]
MLNIIGLMSGTSLDGVDAALIETDGERIGRRGPVLTVPYSEDLRARLRELLDRAPSLHADDTMLRQAEHDLTMRHVEAVQQLCQKTEIQPDLIGFHGQTILHAPHERRTWQIGDAALLSRQTGLPVVHDFRSADVAAGGQGAPLVPLYHAALLKNEPKPVAILNIGGVANITLLGENEAVYACDSGPGNALLDDWAMRHTGRPYDENGKLARKGHVEGAILENLLADPFFTLPPPKSLDRLTFHRAMRAVEHLSPEDGAATLAAFTIEAIVRTPMPEKPRAWFVGGGGRRNPVLMEGLAARLAAPVSAVEALEWDGDGLEAECFGFLAARCLRGLAISQPSITGVPEAMSGGRLTCSDLTPPPWMGYAITQPT